MPSRTAALRLSQSSGRSTVLSSSLDPCVFVKCVCGCDLQAHLQTKYGSNTKTQKTPPHIRVHSSVSQQSSKCAPLDLALKDHCVLKSNLMHGIYFSAYLVHITRLLSPSSLFFLLLSGPSLVLSPPSTSFHVACMPLHCHSPPPPLVLGGCLP